MLLELLEETSLLEQTKKRFREEKRFLINGDVSWLVKTKGEDKKFEMFYKGYSGETHLKVVKCCEYGQLDGEQRIIMEVKRIHSTINASKHYVDVSNWRPNGTKKYDVYEGFPPKKKTEGIRSL